MLVRRAIDAFLSQDWSMVEDDFLAREFFGMHAHPSDADSWRRQCGMMRQAGANVP
jgi:hypothetical protein